MGALEGADAEMDDPEFQRLAVIGRPRHRRRQGGQAGGAETGQG